MQLGGQQVLDVLKESEKQQKKLPQWAEISSLDEYLFPRRMFEHWNKLSREMMEYSTLEMLQTCVRSVSNF